MPPLRRLATKIKEGRAKKKSAKELSRMRDDIAQTELSRMRQESEDGNRWFRGSMIKDPALQKYEASSVADRRIGRISKNLDKLRLDPVQRYSFVRSLRESPHAQADSNLILLAGRQGISAEQFPVFARRVSRILSSAKNAAAGRYGWQNTNIRKDQALSDLPSGLGMDSTRVLAESVARRIRNKRYSTSRQEGKSRRKEAISDEKSRRKIMDDTFFSSPYWDLPDERLGLVHLTRFFPKKGVIIPRSEAIAEEERLTDSRPFRNTIHFSLNSTVGSHFLGSWADRQIGVYVPYSRAKHWIYNPYTVDTFGLGKFRLPNGSRVFVSKDYAEKNGLKHGDSVGSARLHVVDLDEIRKKQFAAGHIDSQSLEEFKTKKFDDFLKKRWKETGGNESFEKFKEKRLKGGIEYDLDELVHARRFFGFPAPDGDKYDTMSGLIETAVRHDPTQIYDHFGAGKPPEKTVLGDKESPFHYAIQDYMKKLGLPVFTAGAWNWRDGGSTYNPKYLEKKFERDGFRTQSPHSHTAIDGLDVRRYLETPEDHARLESKVAATKSVVRSGRSGERQKRLIDEVAKQIKEYPLSRKEP